MERGVMPHCAKLRKEGSLGPMDSVIPTISSVAWATFATGVNPARHNIFGFVDRDENAQLVIPNASQLRARPLWQRFDEFGKRSIWVNLPIAYPPAPINGAMISGFLGTDLHRCVHPPRLLPILQRSNYIIDPDPWLARSDCGAYLKELFRALRARRDVALHLLEEPWDFFMLHVMETDRLHHFFWDAKDDPRSPFYESFWGLYRQLDQLISELMRALPPDCELLMLSDHGFCTLKQEVDLNVHLQELGFLKYRDAPAQAPCDLHPQTRAYSLIPGRIYVNLQGRERPGTVKPSEYEQVREELCQALLSLKVPETDEPVIEKVLRREEIYDGPNLDRAPDLIALARPGYDLKGKLNGTKLFDRSAIVGMHTFDNAFLYVRGHTWTKLPLPALIDVTPTIGALMGLPRVPEWEGRSLLEARA
jgi:predicted AlkP superfamily phosphohydrolase/phosphomutase